MTTYYSTGTASVSNGGTTVTGSGTAWASVVQAGDLFLVPAQGLVAMITAVASNTSITIDAWPGTTISGAAYKIVFASDAIRQSERARQLLEQLSAIDANGRGLFYLFDDGTTDADPGAGNLRLNNATIASATAAYADNLDANGATVSTVLDTWDDTGSSAGRGQLWLRQIADPSIFHAFNVTGSAVDGTGYRKLTLSYIGGSGTFSDADEIMVQFVPVGNGQGVPTGGTTGQALVKSSATDYATTWATQREVLTANRTYYVRTDGSDSNNGLANTSGGAFLTIQKAWDTAVTLDLSGFTVTASVGAGTFSAGINASAPLVGGLFIVDGAGATTIVSTTSANCFRANGFGVKYTVQNVKLTSTSAAGLRAEGGGQIFFSGVDFGACNRHIISTEGAQVQATGNYSITGAASRHINCDGQAYAKISGVTVTITGTPAFSSQFVYAANLGYVFATTTTFSGSATGQRYNISTNSVVATGGGGASYLPGDTSGASATGAQYV